jgi:hypothetical protein
MAHTTWIYADGSGINHTIGLYHGSHDGHVAIYCDKKIIQIDFSVKKSAIYSFFIEDEFCEIHINQQKSGAFYYEFKVNTTVKTPKNIERKRLQKREHKQLAIVGVTLLCFVIGLLSFHYYQKRRQLIDTNVTYSNPDFVADNQLHKEGLASFVRFYLLPKSSTAVYSFQTAQQEQVSGSISAGPGQPLRLPTGFPLYDLDEFEVVYHPSNPLIHQINFFKPLPKTIQNYIDNAVETEANTTVHKNSTISPCIVETVFLEKGWRSLLLISQQNDSPNAKKEYQQLLFDLQEAIKKRCNY